MVGVPAQVGAVVGAGVEVADALVVGEEGDPAGDEHGAGQMAVEVGQQALPVQPQAARGAAAVPLPGGRFVRRGAGEEQGLALAGDVGDLDVGDRAPGQPPAGVAVGGDLVGPGVVREGLAVGGHGEDVALRGPAAHLGVGAAPVRQLVSGAAVDVDEVDLGDEAAPGRVGDPAAVGREARVAGLGAVSGEPPGAARGVQGGQPEIVLRDEAQQVAAEVGKTQIAHVPMLFRSHGASNLWGSRPPRSLQPLHLRDPTHVRNGFVSLTQGVSSWMYEDEGSGAGR